MVEEVLVKDPYGNLRQLQRRDPVLRPEGADPDCAYCTKKPSCSGRGASGRQFYVGDKNPPCNVYYEVNEEVKAYEKLKEQQKIFNPSPRPEEAERDCLFCRLLRERKGLLCRSGPWQGQNKACDNYSEIIVRPEGEPQRCIYCLQNFTCSYARIMNDGTPCERYKEYAPGIWG